jgi:hypothetical protein
MLLAATAAPRLFLALLGAHYQGLDRELLLVVATAGISLLGGYVVNVNLARSWTRWQPATVAVEALALVVVAPLLPLATTAGILTLGIVAAATGTALQLGVALCGFLRPSWVHWQAVR